MCLPKQSGWLTDQMGLTPTAEISFDALAKALVPLQNSRVAGSRVDRCECSWSGFTGWLRKSIQEETQVDESTVL